jgi:hypothetical protein
MLGEYRTHQRRVVMARHYPFFISERDVMHSASVIDSVVAARIWKCRLMSYESQKKQSYNQRDSKFNGVPRNLLFAINVT